MKKTGSQLVFFCPLSDFKQSRPKKKFQKTTAVHVTFRVNDNSCGSRGNKLSKQPIDHIITSFPESFQTCVEKCFEKMCFQCLWKYVQSDNGVAKAPRGNSN